MKKLLPSKTTAVLVLLISKGKDKSLLFRMQIFFFSLQVRSSQEFILLRKEKIYFIGIYRGTVLIQSFLFYSYCQYCCDVDYLCCSLLLSHIHEILQDVNLCPNKNFIYINRRGGKQESFLLLPKVFLSMPSENVIFTTFPTFVWVFFSSKSTTLFGLEGTYF